MTEAHTYQLSTAENELGVVIAHSEEGKKYFLLILK
jgi:exosome complex component CSL4